MGEGEQDRYAKKHDQRHFHARLAIDLGDQVGGRDINRYAGRDGQAVADRVLADHHGQDACQCRQAQQHRREPRTAFAESAGQHHRGDGEAFGNFVQKHGDERSSSPAMAKPESRR